MLCGTPNSCSGPGAWTGLEKMEGGHRQRLDSGSRDVTSVNNPKSRYHRQYVAVF